MFSKAVLLTVFASALLVLASPKKVPDDFGKVVYKVPAGWSATSSGGELHISPTDLASGQICRIVLFPTGRRASAFKTYFTNRWKEFKAGFTARNEGDVISRKDDDGHDALVITASLEKEG